MLRDPSLLLLQLALVAVPCALLGALACRYAATPGASLSGAWLRALLWSVPLTWVLAVEGFGHGGIALLLPAWWVIGASLVADVHPGIAYPSPWLAMALPVLTYLAVVHVACWRHHRRA